jgi:microcystin degradation protein MlrC
LFGDQRGHVTEVHHSGDLHALMCSREAEIINGIVRYRERMKIDLANTKVPARLDLFDALRALARRFGSSFATVKRSLT